MSRFSIDNIPVPTVETAEMAESIQVNLLTKDDFQELKEKLKGSKAETVMVGFRMTAAERKSLRSISAQAEVSIQDILREGVALWRTKHGLR